MINNQKTNLDILLQYGSECRSILDLGSGMGRSSEILLNSLVKSESPLDKKIVCVDVKDYSKELENVKKRCVSEKIGFEFLRINDLSMKMNDIMFDMIHIDTFCVYEQLYHELSKFSSHAEKYIVIQNTHRFGSKSELVVKRIKPSRIIRCTMTKSGMLTGLMPAISKFILNNAEWKIVENSQVSNGVVVLCRIPSYTEAVVKTVPHPTAFTYSDDRQSFYPGLTGATAMVAAMATEQVVKTPEQVAKTPEVVVKTPEVVVKTLPHPTAFTYSDNRKSFYPGLTGGMVAAMAPEPVVKKKESIVKKKESVVKTPEVVGKKSNE